MNKSDIIRAVSDMENIRITQATRIVDTVFDMILEELEKGESVKLRNFGTFDVVSRGGYEFKNPKTNKISKVEERKKPVFIPSKNMKKKVIEGDLYYGADSDQF